MDFEMSEKPLTQAERIAIIRKAHKQALQGKASTAEPTAEPEPEPESTAEPEPTAEPCNQTIAPDVAEGILRRHHGFCRGSILETCDGGEE